MGSEQGGGGPPVDAGLQFDKVEHAAPRRGAELRRVPPAARRVLRGRRQHDLRGVRAVGGRRRRQQRALARAGVRRRRRPAGDDRLVRDLDGAGLAARAGRDRRRPVRRLGRPPGLGRPRRLAISGAGDGADLRVHRRELAADHDQAGRGRKLRVHGVRRLLRDLPGLAGPAVRRAVVHGVDHHRHRAVRRLEDEPPRAGERAVPAERAAARRRPPGMPRDHAGRSGRRGARLRRLRQPARGVVRGLPRLRAAGVRRRAEAPGRRRRARRAGRRAGPGAGRVAAGAGVAADDVRAAPARAGQGAGAERAGAGRRDAGRRRRRRAAQARARARARARAARVVRAGRSGPAVWARSASC